MSAGGRKYPSRLPPQKPSPRRGLPYHWWDSAAFWNGVVIALCCAAIIGMAVFLFGEWFQ